MLITCPECNKKISNKSEVCIHCGYPLKKINICNINGVEYDFSDILSDIDNGQRTPASFVGQISDMCNIPVYEAKEIYFKIKNSNKLPQNVKRETKEQPNIPKCPTCGSTNIKPISATERATSIIGLGIFSKKINKTFKCLNCKCTW